jgi:pyrimidine operon attenuation protein/uracil phosphoribosyltransferase
MDALIDFGRPRSIELAVLVDRGGRELTICAHYVALEHKVSPQETINVYLAENSEKDEVVVEVKAS